MVLHASSQIQNVKTSLEKFIYDVFDSGLGWTIDYEGTAFESGVTKDAFEWVQPRVLDIFDDPWKPKSASNRRGNRASMLLSMNFFVTKSGTTKHNRHYEMRDIAMGSMYSGVSIPLRDYHGGTTRPWTCLMQVADLETDRSIPNDEGYWQYNLTFSIEWQREWPST